MERSPEVEELAVQWMERMRAGDAAGVGGLCADSAATLIVGNGPEQWFPGQAWVADRLPHALADGGVPFAAGEPVGWANGDTGWFADQVTIEFPEKKIPLRLTGVAVRQQERWLLVQIHLSAGVSDEDLLAG